MGQATSTPEPAASHGAAEHHGSWAPIIVAASVGFLYLAILWAKLAVSKAALPLGVAIATVGIGWWIREDLLRFRTAIAHSPKEAQAPGPLWGMGLFIATEVIIFGSIFAIWFVGRFDAYRAGHLWRPAGFELPVPPTLVNTIILVSSGATLHWGYLRLKKNHYNQFLVGLALTILLGAIFLIGQVREYLNLIDEGLTLKGYAGQPNLYGSSFFMLTGTHGFHVFGGLLFLSIVLLRSLKRTQNREHHVALETAAMYWHFVDVVWIFLFAVVYLELL